MLLFSDTNFTFYPNNLMFFTTNFFFTKDKTPCIVEQMYLYLPLSFLVGGAGEADGSANVGETSVDSGCAKRGACFLTVLVGPVKYASVKF